MTTTKRKVVLIDLAYIAAAGGIAWYFSLSVVGWAIIAVVMLALFREPIPPCRVDYRTKGVRLDK